MSDVCYRCGNYAAFGTQPCAICRDREKIIKEQQENNKILQQQVDRANYNDKQINRQIEREQIAISGDNFSRSAAGKVVGCFFFYFVFYFLILWVLSGIGMNADMTKLTSKCLAFFLILLVLWGNIKQYSYLAIVLSYFVLIVSIVKFSFIGW